MILSVEIILSISSDIHNNVYVRKIVKIKKKLIV